MRGGLRSRKGNESFMRAESPSMYEKNIFASILSGLRSVVPGSFLHKQASVHLFLHHKPP